MRLSLVLTMLLFGTPSFASVVDTQVQGQMLILSNPPNYFDPINGFVPSGYQNSAGCSSPSCTVAISPATPTFGYEDGNSTISADFSSGTELILSDSFLVNALPIEYDFTDAAFSNALLVSATDGITFSFSGDTLTIDTPSSVRAATYSAVFDINTAPEPSTWLQLVSGLAISGICIRRRRAKNVRAAELVTRYPMCVHQ